MLARIAKWVAVILVIWWAIDHPANAAHAVADVVSWVVAIARGLGHLGTTLAPAKAAK